MPTIVYPRSTPFCNRRATSTVTASATSARSGATCHLNPEGMAIQKRNTRRPRVEDLADFQRQCGRREGLLQEGDLVLEDAVANDLVVGIARKEENPQLREQRLQTLGRLAPAELRH